MAKYITNICDQWESMNIAGFSNWLGRLLAKEIVDQRDLNRASRDLLKGILKEETENRKITKYK